MSDMLQHQESYALEIERHQLESRRWAQAGLLGRLADSAGAQSRSQPRRSRFLALTMPVAMAVGALAIII